MFERLGSVILVDPSRAAFNDGIAEHDIDQLARRTEIRTLQCSTPVRESVWSLLNDRFFSLRPDVELRVYGHYGVVCDLSFAGGMTHVRRFAADGLMHARTSARLSAVAAARRSVARLDSCGALRRVVLQNLKGLGEFAGIAEAPALEEFALLEGLRQQPEQLVPILRHPTVRAARALFGSDRRNEIFAHLRDSYGKCDWDPSAPFEYR